MSVKILLADDHHMILDGLKLILSNDPALEVVGEAENGQQVLDFLKQTLVDIVVLDINMPVMDGITCARRIKELHPGVRVIILTMYAQRSFIEEIVKIGIDGCLLKNSTGKELEEAIRRVVSGKSYYDEIQSFNSSSEAVTAYKLSERELEIIRFIAEGLTSTEIAEKLFISSHTVKTHRKNIMKKLDMKNTSSLVQYAINNGIV